MCALVFLLAHSFIWRLWHNDPSCLNYSYSLWLLTIIVLGDNNCYVLGDNNCYDHHQYIFYRYLRNVIVIMIIISSPSLLLFSQACQLDGENQSPVYEFDAFVAYSSDDSDFVLTVLKPELEERQRLRLCIHERDFFPGRNIVENIADCINSSKALLFIFSKAFSRSQWCSFELEIGITMVQEHSLPLVIIHCDDLPKHEIKGAMQIAMRLYRCFHWSNTNRLSGDKTSEFWTSVKTALQTESPVNAGRKLTVFSVWDRFKNALFKRWMVWNDAFRRKLFTRQKMFD